MPFSIASWSDGCQYSTKYWTCHRIGHRDVIATLVPREGWLRSKEDFVEVAKTDLAVPENDLSVDSSRVGDL
jgi:hypothetical protein